MTFDVEMPLIKSMLIAVSLSNLVLLMTAAIIPSPSSDVHMPVNTLEPGPIPPAYNIFNRTYLNELDESHGPINYSQILLGSRRPPKDSCTGSHYCTWSPWFSGGVDSLSCELAYMKFVGNAWYERYASYTEGHCAAIFNCWPPHGISGSTIQKRFDEIKRNGCKKCGVHYFNGFGATDTHQCYVKLDYCWNCHQKGGPTMPEPPYHEPDQPYRSTPPPSSKNQSISVLPVVVGAVGNVHMSSDMTER